MKSIETGNSANNILTGSFGNLNYHELIDVERSPGFIVKGGLGDDWIRVDLDDTPFIAGQTYVPTAGGPGTFPQGVTLYGEGGHDILQGGLDDDRLFGGEGHDLLTTWDGNDVLNGGSGDDSLSSNDFFFGKNQTEGTNFAVTADDFYFGDTGKDFITDNWGHDTALGGEDSDFIALGSGSDILLGGGGNDALYGDATFSGIHGQRDWFLNFNAQGQPVGVTQAQMTFEGMGT